MDAKLSDQLAAVIDALALPHTLAEQVTERMRHHRVFFGLLYRFPDGDIAQLNDKLRCMKFLAELRAQAGE